LTERLRSSKLNVLHWNGDTSTTDKLSQYRHNQHTTVWCLFRAPHHSQLLEA